MATALTELRWWRPCSYLYLYAAQAGTQAPALAVVACIHPREVLTSELLRGRLSIQLWGDSLVDIDLMLATTLHRAKESGWYAATATTLFGPVHTPEEGQRRVLEFLGVGQAQEAAHG